MRSIRNSAKRPIKLSINAKALDMSREMGLNISQTADALLTEAAARQHGQRWNTHNAEAFAHGNARIESEGLPLARYRSFMMGDNPAEPFEAGDATATNRA